MVNWAQCSTRSHTQRQTYVQDHINKPVNYDTAGKSLQTISEWEEHQKFSKCPSTQLV